MGDSEFFSPHARAKIKLLSYISGRHGGLMFSVLDSGSSDPGLSFGRGTAFCSKERHFTLTVPLSTQVYKWVLANLMLGVTLRWTSIPSRKAGRGGGGVEIILVASC